MIIRHNFEARVRHWLTALKLILNLSLIISLHWMQRCSNPHWFKSAVAGVNCDMHNPAAIGLLCDMHLLQ